MKNVLAGCVHVVCVGRIDTVILPCGHLVACKVKLAAARQNQVIHGVTVLNETNYWCVCVCVTQACGERLANKECPVCKASIQRVNLVYVPDA